MWTDKSGREIRAEYVSATKYMVEIRRVSDDRVFTVPITSLSKADQDYVTGKLKRGETDPYIVSSSSRLVEVSKPRPVLAPIGVGIVPDRMSIPSLDYHDLGEGYPAGPSTLVNILVWWGDTIAPDIMPHSRRDNSIERIADDIQIYFDDDSNSFARITQGMENYSEKKLKGHAVKVHPRVNAPDMDELEKLTNGWNGVVALYGLYDSHSSGDFRRVGGRYTTLVDVQGRSLLNTLMGFHYSLQIGDKRVFPDERQLSRLLRGSAEKGFLEVVNPSLVPGPLLSDGKVVLLESVVAFELFKLPDAED